MELFLLVSPSKNVRPPPPGKREEEKEREREGETVVSGVPVSFPFKPPNMGLRQNRHIHMGVFLAGLVWNPDLGLNLKAGLAPKDVRWPKIGRRRRRFPSAPELATHLFDSFDVGYPVIQGATWLKKVKPWFMSRSGRYPQGTIWMGQLQAGVELSIPIKVILEYKTPARRTDSCFCS